MDSLEIAAYVIFTLDVIFFILWSIGWVAIFSLQECRTLLFVDHFLLVVHIIGQTATIFIVIDQWNEKKEERISRSEEEEEERSQELVSSSSTTSSSNQQPITKKKRKPTPIHQTHSHLPVTWIFASVIALVGDIAILVNHSIQYPDFTGRCKTYMGYELFVESLAVLTASLSVLWFISIIANRKRRKSRIRRY